MSNTATTRPVRVYTMRKYPDSPKWVRELLHERAWFHSFGTDYEEFDNGPGLHPVAIVELADGTVISPHATMIQFIDPLSLKVPTHG
jgi:hypothetical protein